MPRQCRHIPPFLSARERTHLAFLIALLVCLIAGAGWIGQPSAWNWMFAGPPIDSQLSDPPPPDRESIRADHANSIVMATNAQPPERDKGADETNPVIELTTSPDAPLPSNQVTETPDEKPAGAAQVNPLGLRNIGGCETVDTAMLSSVRDDLDPTSRTRRPDRELVENLRNATLANYHLLCVAATRSQAQLRTASRRDVVIANLWRDPAAFRGTPIHIEGVLRRLEIQRTKVADQNAFGIDTVYEAWIRVENSDTWAMVLLTKLPEGLVPGEKTGQKVSCDAYFLRLYAYRAQDARFRGVPQLVGYTLNWKRVPESSIAAQGAFVLVGIIVVILAATLAFWRQSKKDERLAESYRSSAVRPDVFEPELFDRSPADQNIGATDERPTSENPSQGDSNSDD